MIFVSDETISFIDHHRNDDVVDLLLHPHKNANIDFEFAISQIEGFQKSKKKLPFLSSQKGVIYPKKLSLEQCSSEKTADYKATLVSGNVLVDLTGGFGIDTLSFAKKFKKVTYVERDVSLCNIMIHNCEVLGLRNVEVLNGTAEEVLPQIDNVDVIYLDPARRDCSGDKVSRLDKCTPNVLELKSLLLKKAQKAILVKVSPLADIKDALSQLPEITSFYVVSVKNECKELLLHIQKEMPSIEPKINTIELSDSVKSCFSFDYSEENNAFPEYTSSISRFLYEPSSAILKAGAFKLLAVRFGLKKLHVNSHLYTSDVFVGDFPGKVYQVEEFFSFCKKDLKSHFTQFKNRSLKVRNFPLSVDELGKRISCANKGDGKTCLFATTLSSENHIMILASLIENALKDPLC